MKKAFSLILVAVLIAFVAGCMGDDGSTEAQPGIADQLDIQTGGTDADAKDDTEDEAEDEEGADDTKTESSGDDSTPVVTPLKEDECKDQEPVTYVRFSSKKKQLHLIGAPLRKSCPAYGECSMTLQAKGGSGEYFIKAVGLPKDLVVEGMGFSGTLKNPATYIAAIIISDKKCLQNYVVVPFELTVEQLYIE